MRDHKRTISRPKLIAVILICLWMGTVFTFGLGYSHASISREQAIEMEAIYQSCRIFKRYSTQHSAVLYFSGLEPMSIDVSCLNSSLVNELDKLTAGKTIHFLVHPNSNTILELEVDGKTLMEFEDSMESITRSRYAFHILGLIFYAALLIAGIQWLIRHRRKRRNQKKRRIK